MAEENDKKSIQSDVFELENGDKSYDPGTLAEKIIDDSVEQGKMMPDDGDGEESDSLGGETTDPIEKIGDLRKDSDIPQGTEGKTSPSEKTNSPKDRVRSSAFVVGANHKFPIRSRYLSASVGSCHDLCKYGHRHEPEKKIKRHSLGTIREAKPLMRTSSDNLTKSVPNQGAKKKTYVRGLSVPCPPILEKDSPTKSRLTGSGKDINQSKSRRIQSEVKPPSAAESSSSKNKSDFQSGKKIVVQRPNLGENTRHTKKDAGSHSKHAIEKEKDEERAKESVNHSMSPRTPLKKSPSIKARLYKNLRSISHSKKQSTSEESQVKGSGNVFEKTVKKIELNIDKKHVKKASKKIALSNGSSSNTSQGFLAKGNKGPMGSQKRIQNDQSSSHSLSEPVSTSSTEQMPSQTKTEKQNCLNPVNTKVVGKKVTSIDGSRTNTPRLKSNEDIKMNFRRRGSTLQEEKDGSAWKVKFKRGTVVALQVANSTPRKLRFKRGRVFGDDQAKNETVKGLKNGDDTGNEPNDVKHEPRKVQLRHQEALGKKDNVDLNNVIEETASKLAMTRKSKVKALVGAFETVMSLGERKPAVQAGALS